MNQSNILLSLVWSGSCRLRSPNGAGNARHAATNILASVMPSIEDHIAWTAPDIGRDESPVRCNARRGYAWIAVAEDAVYCAVVGSRGSAMLEIHFAAFRDIPSVTDEYAAYKRPENSQSDWFHMLRKAEKRGIYGDGRDFALYMRLLGMYHEIKKWDTADEETAKILADRVLQVAPEYGEGHEMYTVLFNALPTLFTFLGIRACLHTATPPSRSSTTAMPSSGGSGGRSKTKRAPSSSAPSSPLSGHAASAESPSPSPFSTCSATARGTSSTTANS